MANLGRRRVVASLCSRMMMANLCRRMMMANLCRRREMSSLCRRRRVANSCRRRMGSLWRRVVMFTIEAVGAKVAVPQARALQTPAAFSPTPESTEFVPFCSLSPPLICRRLRTHPLQDWWGPWALVQDPQRKTFPLFPPLSLFPIFSFVQLSSMPACWFFVSLKIKRSCSCNRERE